MSKKSEPEYDSTEEPLSICSIMKEDTSAIIKKMESQMPALSQNYADLYTKYLHLFGDIFETCYIAETEFFDKLNIDQGILKQMKANFGSIRDNYIENMDMAAKLFDEYVKMRISAIQSFDNYVHVMMDSYAKIQSQFNKSIKSSD